MQVEDNVPPTRRGSRIPGLCWWCSSKASRLSPASARANAATRTPRMLVSVNGSHL